MATNQATNKWMVGKRIDIRGHIVITWADSHGAFWTQTLVQLVGNARPLQRCY